MHDLKKTLVSVIMPTFNRLPVLVRAIASVLDQTYKNFELIIIDDGSTDGTADYLTKLKDKRIKIISQNNMGAARARNAGLKKTSGRYIAYLDSDNVWHDKFLEVMVESIDNNQMIYCSQNLLFCDNENGENKVIARKTHNAPYNPVALLKENYIDINAVLHTRTILDKIGYFDESLETSEDWDLFARIAIAYPFRIKHIDQVLCDYYYYTDRALATITNTNYKTSSLRTFGLENKHKDTLYLQKKFQQIVKKTYK